MNSQGARAIVREVLFLLFCIQLGVAHNNDLVLQCSSPIKLFPSLKPRGAHSCLLREIGNDLAHGHRHGMRLAHERGGITEWKFPKKKGVHGNVALNSAIKHGSLNEISSFAVIVLEI